MKPTVGDAVVWLPRDSTRRKNGSCKGTYVGTDSDGWFRVKYVWGSPGAYKNRVIRIEPKYVVRIERPDKGFKDSLRRFVEADKKLAKARGGK